MLLLAGLPQPGLGLWNAFDGAPGVALLSDRRHPLYSTPLRDAAVSASLATPVLQTRTMEYLRHCDAGDASPAEQSAEGEGEGEPAAEGDGQEEGGTAPNSRCCSPVPLRGGYVGPGARIGVDLPRVALASVSRLRHELRYELWHGSPTEVWSSMAAVTAALVQSAMLVHPGVHPEAANLLSGKAGGLLLPTNFCKGEHRSRHSMCRAWRMTPSLPLPLPLPL